MAGVCTAGSLEPHIKTKTKQKHGNKFNPPLLPIYLFLLKFFQFYLAGLDVKAPPSFNFSGVVCTQGDGMKLFLEVKSVVLLPF